MCFDHLRENIALLERFDTMRYDTIHYLHRKKTDRQAASLI